MWSVAKFHRVNACAIRRWDSILTALALNLDENREVGGSLAIPRGEGLQELETVTLGVNGNLDARTVLRRRLEGVLAGVVTLGRELITGGVGEFKCLAVRSSQSVRERVEAEVTSKGHGSDDVGRSDEGVRSRIRIITASEVTVVGSDDGVNLAFLDVLSVPLANARSASVGQDDTTNILKGSNLSVTLNSGAYLFRSGGDSKLALRRQTVGGSLANDGRRAGHILVRRVGARTDERNLEFGGPAILLNLACKLRDGGSQIRSEGTVDMGLELREILFNDVRIAYRIIETLLLTISISWSYSAPSSAFKLCAKL